VSSDVGGRNLSAATVIRQAIDCRLGKSYVKVGT
jgi:hypothetical protein